MTAKKSTKISSVIFNIGKTMSCDKMENNRLSETHTKPFN